MIPFLILLTASAFFINDGKGVKEYKKTPDTVETTYIRIRNIPFGGVLMEVRDTLVVYQEYKSVNEATNP